MTSSLLFHDDWVDMEIEIATSEFKNLGSSCHLLGRDSPDIYRPSQFVLQGDNTGLESLVDLSVLAWQGPGGKRHITQRELPCIHMDEFWDFLKIHLSDLHHLLHWILTNGPASSSRI